MNNENPEEVYESFRQALREALKDNPHGDFGAEAAVEAFNECLELARREHPPASFLTSLGEQLRALGSGNPTSNTLRRCRLDLEAYERTVETEERRARQAKELDEKPDESEPVNWLGDIGTFAEDMVFHAKRLGRNIRGRFNGVELVATPSSTAHDVFVQFDEARPKGNSL